jgi:hypothetical protein
MSPLLSAVAKEVSCNCGPRTLPRCSRLPTSSIKTSPLSESKRMHINVSDFSTFKTAGSNVKLFVATILNVSEDVDMGSQEDLNNSLQKLADSILFDFQIDGHPKLFKSTMK